MDRSQELTAAEVVNTYGVPELTRVLRDYGEERYAFRIAKAIARRRATAPIESTKVLAELVRTAIPAATRRTGGNPAKRTFQALRIEVNAELSVWARALPRAVAALAVGGRIAVLSYHSLEDRITKRVLTEGLGSSRPIADDKTEDGRALICSTHGALYEPDTGLCTAGPCAGDRLTPLPLHVENDTLVVRCDGSAS